MSDDIINILLVGEVGVGKTTIINALPSILKHCSFSSVTSEKVEILQTIDFMYTDDDYQQTQIEAEPTISIEKPNNFESDLSIPSVVTQFPASYTFTYEGQRYRIIDTPGVGDVRGIEQNQANVEKLMNYLVNFECIHAIVMIIGQESQRATTGFKFIMSQVLLQLHESAINNFLFCFTKCPQQSFMTDQVTITNQYFANREIGIKLSDNNTFYVDNEWVRTAILLEKNISLKPNLLEQSEEQFVHSREMFLRMLKTAKTLPGHDVMNSICINTVRNILMSTVELRANLLLSIPKSIDDLADIKNKLRQGHSQTMLIQRQLGELLTEDKNYEILSQIVCDYCKTDDEKPLVCHKDCQFEEMKELPREKLLSCIKFEIGKTCLRCSCGYDRHRYERLQLENQKIKEKRKEKETVEQSTTRYSERIQQLKNTIHKSREELDFLTIENPLFAIYLQRNSIISTNDEYEEYIRYLEASQIAEEDSANVKRISQCHNKMKEYIKKAMEENAEKQSILTTAYIMHLIKEMKDLSHSDTTLKQILDRDETMRQSKNYHDIDITRIIS